MAHRNLVLDGLRETDLAVLAPYLVDLTLRQGQVLHNPGEVAEHIYLPSSAVISVVTTMADGRYIETATIGRESAAGVLSALSGAPVRSRNFCQVSGAATRLSAARLREHALQTPALLQFLIRHADLTVAQAQQSAACNALHDTTARLARWLLMTEDRVGRPELPLTQEYLAGMLGVQRTTVTLVAGLMKKAGMIRYMRGAITVLDRAALEKTACECYAALRCATADSLVGS